MLYFSLHSGGVG